MTAKTQPAAPLPTELPAPRWIRWARWIWVIGFAEGLGAHLWDVGTGGLHAYRSAPLPAQLLFHALLLLDPLVVVLLLRRRPSAAPIGAAVMALDVAANWWADAPLLAGDPAGVLLRPYGLPVITLFGCFVLATARPLHRELTRTVTRG
ncbi:hypothetical protein [Phaeacidiphilus oryzae]|uniref:hypothetical protein n=1 Tax=Phaeacidiphilus oryzae TaxID=348818 RepID=UPI001F2C131A|nr:hypothetical protein [Phaeacidiphilus oryzae]